MLRNIFDILTLKHSYHTKIYKHYPQDNADFSIFEGQQKKVVMAPPCDAICLRKVDFPKVDFFKLLLENP